MKAINLVTEPRIDPSTVVLDDEQLKTNSGSHQKLNVPAIFSGAGTPTATDTVPSKIGDIYVDTTNHKMYIAEDADDVDGFIILN